MGMGTQGSPGGYGDTRLTGWVWRHKAHWVSMGTQGTHDIYHLPQGQYGYTGHVINMPQDLSVFATSLPRLPSKLDVMIVRKKGSNTGLIIRF